MTSSPLLPLSQRSNPLPPILPSVHVSVRNSGLECDISMLPSSRHSCISETLLALVLFGPKGEYEDVGQGPIDEVSET